MNPESLRERPGSSVPFHSTLSALAVPTMPAGWLGRRSKRWARTSFPSHLFQVSLGSCLRLTQSRRTCVPYHSDCLHLGPLPSYRPSVPASPLSSPVSSNLSPYSPNLNLVLPSSSSALTLPGGLLSKKREITGLEVGKNFLVAGVIELSRKLPQSK